jgi:hypothetical protein
VWIIIKIGITLNKYFTSTRILFCCSKQVTYAATLFKLIRYTAIRVIMLFKLTSGPGI